MRYVIKNLKNFFTVIEDINTIFLNLQLPQNVYFKVRLFLFFTTRVSKSSVSARFFVLL